jgi:hypothetical protein
MGEFSDYFEQFPEENPANQNERGQYDPEYRAEREKRRIANEKLDAALRSKQPLSSGTPPVKRKEPPKL